MDLEKVERVTGTYYYKQKYDRLKKVKAALAEKEAVQYTPEELIDPIKRAKQIIRESKNTDAPLSNFTLNEKMVKKYSQNFKKY